jgi:hypothetical protein
MDAEANDVPPAEPQSQSSPPPPQSTCTMCTNHTQKVVNGKKVSLLRFPADVSRRKCWIHRAKPHQEQPIKKKKATPSVSRPRPPRIAVRTGTSKRRTRKAPRRQQPTITDATAVARPQQETPPPPPRPKEPRHKEQFASASAPPTRPPQRTSAITGVNPNQAEQMEDLRTTAADLELRNLREETRNLAAQLRQSETERPPMTQSQVTMPSSRPLSSPSFIQQPPGLQSHHFPSGQTGLHPSQLPTSHQQLQTTSAASRDILSPPQPHIFPTGTSGLYPPGLLDFSQTMHSPHHQLPAASAASMDTHPQLQPFSGVPKSFRYAYRCMYDPHL